MAIPSSQQCCFQPINGNPRNGNAHPLAGRGYRAAGYSVIGRRRSANQDCFFLDSSCRLFIVADGMGGGPAGERASRLAVQVLREQSRQMLETTSAARIMGMMRDAFVAANQQLCAEADRVPEHQGMGTTAVMALVEQSRLLVASVGDSRAYLVQNGAAEQLTTDQTMAQILVDSGVYSASDGKAPGANVLWNCLGQPAFQPPIATLHSFEPENLLVLASDGLTDYVDADHLADVVTGEPDPRDAAEQLVIDSVRRGSSDDSTCLVVHLATSRR